MHVCRFRDRYSFLTRTEAFLARAEVENNMFLSLGGRPGAAARVLGDDAYLAAVEHDGEVVGCAVRTPPYKVIITRAESSVLACLIEDLAAAEPDLPSVFGPEPSVTEFARLWADRRGRALRRGMRQRLFEARTVMPLTRRPTGSLRAACTADQDILAVWSAAFTADAHLTIQTEPLHEIRRRVAEGSLFVWDDARPVSMAAWAGRTSRGVRVNFVYTPPEHRHRGYASACVADLSQRLLDEGQSFCCLYADLDNPTSNKIYQAIGYQLVCDASDFHFSALP